MRAIQKGTEPYALRQYRAIPGTTYDGNNFTPVKDAIRDALLHDQLALCCYCMRRISKSSRSHATKPVAPPIIQMKVEHWQSQTHFPTRQLDWTNMLGACLGNEGAPKADQTCDTRKGEDFIALDPLDPAHIKTVRCKSNGRLESTNRRFQDDLDHQLGLNHRILVEDRKAHLDRALRRLKVRYPTSPIPESAVRSLVDGEETPKNGELPAFACVLRLWARARYGNHW